MAVRWYLRYGLSYRDVEELLAERGIDVDHVTVYQWVQRFTPLFADGVPGRDRARLAAPAPLRRRGDAPGRDVPARLRRRARRSAAARAGRLAAR